MIQKIKYFCTWAFLGGFLFLFGGYAAVSVLQTVAYVVEGRANPARLIPDIAFCGGIAVGLMAIIIRRLRQQ